MSLLYMGFAMSISTVFTNNRSQAVRIPSDMRLPECVKKASVHARGVEFEWIQALAVENWVIAPFSKFQEMRPFAGSEDTRMPIWI